MTPEQQRLIFGLVRYPGNREYAPASPEELLAAFDADDGRSLCQDLLEKALSERSADDVELTLIMCSKFGLDRSSLSVLQQLARVPWHTRYQDISETLEEVGGADVVDDLEFLAWAGPEFQDYEGSTALARKAVHSLERIATPSARAALARLRRHPEQDVRDLVDRVEGRMRL
jgi:hypothetical protein